VERRESHLNAMRPCEEKGTEGYITSKPRFYQFGFSRGKRDQSDQSRGRRRQKMCFELTKSQSLQAKYVPAAKGMVDIN